MTDSEISSATRWADLATHETCRDVKLDRLRRSHRRHAEAGVIGFTQQDASGLLASRAPGELNDTPQLVQCTFRTAIEGHVVDRDLGAWGHERARDGTPKADIWPRGPDLHDTWLATLYGRLDPDVGIPTTPRAKRLS